MFDEPEAASGRMNPKDILGHLLLVWSCGYIPDSPTKFSVAGKQSDVIVVDCVNLDQQDEAGVFGVVARSCWWRQNRLIQSLKPRIGRPNPMLVRMTKGVASQGAQAPYELVSMSGDPASVNRANSWLNANPGFTPTEYEAPPVKPAAVPSAQQQEYRPAQASEPTLLERMAQQSQQPQTGGYQPNAERRQYGF